ncbi:S49 family peptidase [Limimaricola hongkongensis]|uniref:Peptidase S49 domain-containing protein n=1 Tax=Limimaricola hongkongensis DSM 17492 TaxID=1122180 RepID=A0A017HBB0_9RHOB|nr:S49 family peptidase [Limimaricola hongkongensis]EYD71802.1 hypothetical protein Lokhon_01872 [Limimaricola hongkongensis DSM 17492]
MRALDAALGTPWAIQSHALEQLLTIAARQHEVTPEALEKYRAEAMDRAETMERRGNVAILNVTGPLFRRANMFTAFSGASSYDVMRRDLQVAIEDRDIKSILLNIDSPGGHANGVGELAKAISDSPKPVVAYVGSTAASAAYWLASAARQIIVDDAAVLGSIGAIIGLSDSSEAEKAKGIRRFDFVSSQSPLKNADPATEDGASEYQRIADQTAAVFIEAVARHRNTTAEAVAEGYGRGGVLIGADAVAAGMADSIGTFEDTLARLAKDETFPRAPKNPRASAQIKPKASAGASTAQNGGLPMSEAPTADRNPATPPVDNGAAIEAARKDAAASAVKADRERRAAIMALPEAKGREGLAEHLYASTEMGVDEIKATLSAAPEAKTEVPAEDAYEQTRLDGRGLGGAPTASKEQPKIDARGIYASRRAG